MKKTLTLILGIALVYSCCINTDPKGNSVTTVNPLSSLNFSCLQAGNSTSTNLIGTVNVVSASLQYLMIGKIGDFGTWNRALTQAERLPYIIQLINNCQRKIVK